MNKYKKYATLKEQINFLNEQLKELEPEILEEIESLTEPKRTEFGTFTTVTRIYWKLSDEAKDKQKALKEKIKEVEQEDIQAGNAEKTEKTGIRFMSTKRGGEISG